ncbi:hypothetical protein [Streptomyces sp. NPDC001020]
MSRQTFARLGIAIGALSLSLAACTTETSGTERTVQPTRSTLPVPTVAVTTPGTIEPSVRKPPELDSAETLAGRQKETRGNASFPYGKGKKGDALIVAARCQGQGKIKVVVSSVHTSFSQKCLTGEVSTDYNQIAVTGADRSGVVSVEAPSAVRWSMTIGRGAPPEEEGPGVG